jgi:hypothetical protein
VYDIFVHPSWKTRKGREFEFTRAWLACAMDIFNRTPSISEDTVQYTLYPPSGQCDKSSVTALATFIHSFVESSLPEFIWHRDTFGVKVVPDPDGEGWVLEGIMRVGDCVDDEWCVVWLLKEISAKWDVVVWYVFALPCF